MKRRFFLGSSMALLAGCPGRPKTQPLAGGESFTVEDLASRLQKGEVEVGQVLDHYLARIAALDQSGPRLRAVMELNPDVWTPAGQGVLHGVPVLIKDNIETADAMETTAGSLALLGARKPGQDAFVVTRLRQAGAVILGKANLSEWANIRSPNSTSGWSARGGLTVNPHNTACSASGSSSGSAVAVAAGLCPAAIGTETNGSIVSPAAACGIVGLKPTVGLVSRSGIIPISRWQDTAGPLTRTVKDAAMLLNVLAGKDPADEFTLQAKAEADYTFGLDEASLQGKRLGILRSFAGAHRGVKKLFDRSLKLLADAGAVLVEDVTVPNHREAGSAAWAALLTEFRQDLNRYLEGRGAVVRSLAELIAYDEEFKLQEMPHFNQEFFIEAEGRFTPEHLLKAEELRTLARRLAGPEGLDAVLQNQRLDAFICPTNDPAGRIDLGLGDARMRTFSTLPAVAGHPHLTVPMGMVNDLPVGLSFVGPAWSERALLSLGHAFERVRQFELPKLFA